LKEKALNHSLGNTRCRRGYGPVVRQITERKKGKKKERKERKKERKEERKKKKD
jgi:hypothetical protein